jgi:hypothetical protein
VTSTVATATSALTSGDGDAAVPVRVRIETDGEETEVRARTEDQDISGMRVVCASGDAFAVAGSDDKVRLNIPAGQNLSFVEVALDAGKWYFDRWGGYLPNGYKPSLSVVPRTGGYTIASSDAISDVRYMYSNGTTSNSTPGPTGSSATTPKATVSYIVVTLRYDSSKWYFDRSGNALPGGYKPTITVKLGSSSVSVQSSDQFDTVKVHFANGTIQGWSTSSLSGSYSFRLPRGSSVDGVMVRLKSDGSKWYFDNWGVPVLDSSKWYTDIDGLLAPAL